jgi:hypothetical protein
MKPKFVLSPTVMTSWKVVILLMFHNIFLVFSQHESPKANPVIAISPGKACFFESRNYTLVRVVGQHFVFEIDFLSLLVAQSNSPRLVSCSEGLFRVLEENCRWTVFKTRF